MLREQQQQKEYIQLLQDQINYLKGDIDFLKNDITHKNIFIENLVGDNSKCLQQINTIRNNGWELAKGNKTRPSNNSSLQLPLKNNFNGLPLMSM